MESFYTEPTLEILNSLKKKELLDAAKHYKLEVTDSASKAEVKKLVLDCLVEEEWIAEPETVSTDELRGQQLLELKRLEFQERERERESQLKLKELELKEKELSIQLKLRELESRPAPIPPTPSTATSTGFGVSKHIRLVPPFQEKEVDKYFVHFEKIANSLEWPQEVWTLLLQSVLTGKAREIYSALSVEKSAQYKEVRQAILKAYELVPEAYRQKFRNCVKQESQTYVEFAREKEALFDCWCAAKQVENDFNKLRQLILIEEFKKCLQSDVKMYLDEQKADGLHQAAVLADNYSLTHKSTFLRLEPQIPSLTLPEGGSRREEQRQLPPPTRVRNSAQGRGRPDNLQKAVGGPVCFYCKRRGHVMAECRVLEKKNYSKNVLTISKAQSPVAERATVEKEQFTSFILQGYVSLSENGEKVPIEILRDTGATQSILVEGILPLAEGTATGNNVRIQGIELGVVNVPLHTIFINSDIVTGMVTVGVRPTLPIKGISLILGNDLAGSRVMPDLQLVKDPEPDQDENALETSIFPACVVTRAAAKRACASQEQREETYDTASATGTTSKSDSTTTIQSSQMIREDKPPLLHNDTQTTLCASYSVLISACSTGGHAQFIIIIPYHHRVCRACGLRIIKQDWPIVLH